MLSVYRSVKELGMAMTWVEDGITLVCPGGKHVTQNMNMVWHTSLVERRWANQEVITSSHVDKSAKNQYQRLERYL